MQESVSGCNCIFCQYKSLSVEEEILNINYLRLSLKVTGDFSAKRERDRNVTNKKQLDENTKLSNNIKLLLWDYDTFYVLCINFYTKQNPGLNDNFFLNNGYLFYLTVIIICYVQCLPKCLTLT